MAFPRRARRLWGYWRAERRTLRQGFVALLLSTLAAFIAGVTLGKIEGTLRALPGLIILIPASVGMRGNISGAIGARLGTSTHAGLFEVTRARSGVLYQNVYVGLISTLATSLYLAVLARLAAAAVGSESISIIDLITISVVGGTIASGIVLTVTVWLAVLSYRRGYDLDAVATPVITAIGDMVSLPCLFLATFLVRVEWLNGVLGAACIAAGLYAAIRGALTDLPQVRRILLEMALVLLLVPILDIAAGTVLDARLDELVASPGLLVLIPPFVSQCGALGGILASRLGSKLQLGVISPRGLPEPLAIVDSTLVVGFALLVFPLIGALGLATDAVLNLEAPGPAFMLGGTLLAGLIATFVTVVVSYYLAVSTARFGLDPDNHGVPIITSMMDLAGVVSFLFVLSVWGPAIHG